MAFIQAVGGVKRPMGILKPPQLVEGKAAIKVEASNRWVGIDASIRLADDVVPLLAIGQLFESRVLQNVSPYLFLTHDLAQSFVGPSSSM